MKNTQWGPSAWLFLHSISFQYPENPEQKDKTNYRLFFESLQNILPCPKCQKHYQENILKNPINLNSRNELIQWVIDIHNSVNKLNGKKEYSLDDVKKLYLTNYNYSIEKNESVDNNLKLILGIILLILIIFYLKN
jgi:hypothetical protein